MIRDCTRGVSSALRSSLQNTVLVCRHAEKTMQLTRLLRRECKRHEAAKFIVYFSTVAAVDYFYRVSLPRLDGRTAG